MKPKSNFIQLVLFILCCLFSCFHFHQTQPLAEVEDELSQLNQSMTEMEIGPDLSSSGEESQDSDSDPDPDTTFNPSSSTPSTESLEEDDSVAGEWDPTRRWIVDEAHIRDLFKFCPNCGKIITSLSPYPGLGGRFVVKWQCHSGCSSSWDSSPKMPHRAADINILSSASVFFTGATYTDIFEWAELLNLQIPKATLFYSIQRNYLIPVIHAAYKKQNDDVIAMLHRRFDEGQRVDLCGDGRSDSPGKLFGHLTTCYKNTCK